MTKALDKLQNVYRVKSRYLQIHLTFIRPKVILRGIGEKKKKKKRCADESSQVIESTDNSVNLKHW